MKLKMVKRRGKKKDNDNARRIVVRAPSVELRNQFEAVAGETNRTASQLGWHCYQLFLQTEEGRRALAALNISEVKQAA